MLPASLPPAAATAAALVAPLLLMPMPTIPSVAIAAPRHCRSPRRSCLQQQQRAAEGVCAEMRTSAAAVAAEAALPHLEHNMAEARQQHQAECGHRLHQADRRSCERAHHGGAATNVEHKPTQPCRATQVRQQHLQCGSDTPPAAASTTTAARGRRRACLQQLLLRSLRRHTAASPPCGRAFTALSKGGQCACRVLLQAFPNVVAGRCSKCKQQAACRRHPGFCES